MQCMALYWQPPDPLFVSRKHWTSLGSLSMYRLKQMERLAWNTVARLDVILTGVCMCMCVCVWQAGWRGAWGGLITPDLCPCVRQGPSPRSRVLDSAVTSSDVRLANKSFLLNFLLFVNWFASGGWTKLLTRTGLLVTALVHCTHTYTYSIFERLFTLENGEIGEQIHQ